MNTGMHAAGLRGTLRRMGLALLGLLAAAVLSWPGAGVAQRKPAPVQDTVGDRESALQRAQMRAGAAYRDVQDAQYRTKLAEQEVWAAEDAVRAGGKDAAETRRRLDQAKGTHAAARSREAAARAAYDKALTDVEQVSRPAAAR